MATNSLPVDRATGRAGTAPSVAHEIWQVVKLMLTPIASLRLTVMLFAMATTLILVGTLAQVEKDMWVVMKDYFYAWFTWVDIRLLFPRSFLSPRTFLPAALADVPGGFPFPGGKLIGLFMFLNLIAAHLVRFKIQARGAALAGGLVIILFGSFVCWMVVASGHNADGLQAEPPFSYSTMWQGVRVGLALGLIGAVAMSVWLALRARHRLVELWSSSISAAILAALAVWVFGFGASLGESSLRVLWQLIQGGLAGVILLPGCWLVFGKRGGIVLLHGGVGLLMFGELLVGLQAVEEQMAIEEGQTLNYAQDIRAVELAAIDRTPEQYDQVVVVPLTEKKAATNFLDEGVIRDERLPFNIEILRFHTNSQLVNAQGRSDNPATHGTGLQVMAVAAKPGTGTDSSGTVDIASAYVKLTNRTNGAELGTYLLTQFLSVQDQAEQVTVDGTTYDVMLRFKRTYKPYSIELFDVRKDDYVGTDTPRDYSSFVRLVDPTRNENRELRIWMNNPLRYAGETFYQSGYHRDPTTGVETTTLQVVTNTGWMIPYVSVMLVVIAMLAHFSTTLLRFLRRRQNPSDETPVTAKVVDDPVNEWETASATAAPLSPWIRVGVPVTVVGLAILGIIAQAIPRSESDDQYHLQSFGELPVAYGGRVKPFDSVARDTLAQLSGKSKTVDENKDRVAAVQWLIDTISHSEKADDYPVFKIDHPDVRFTLGLRDRKHHRYSFGEMRDGMEKFREQVRLAREAPKETRTLYQNKVLDLEQRLQLYLGMREAHRLPNMSTERDVYELANELINMSVVAQDLAAAPVPYALPAHDGAQPWQPVVTAATRLWIKRLGKQFGKTTVDELAEHFSQAILADQANVDALVTARIRRMIEGIAAERNPNLDPAQLREYSAQMLAQMPAEMRQNLETSTRENIQQEAGNIQRNLAAAMQNALGNGRLSDPEDPAAAAMVAMLQAYRADKVTEFNGAVQRVAQHVSAADPAELHESKLAYESFYHRFNPLSLSMLYYVFAALLGFTSLLFWHRPLGRTTFWLLLVTFVLHTFALGSRIYISGRPPVTNLYSSAVFISWGCVVLGLIFEAIYRLGVGNLVAAATGFLSLAIAAYLAAGDTFTVLQAVLDTQFWLAIHVVCITFGYATTFIAGFLALVYLGGGFLSMFTRFQRPQYVGKELTRMIYGTLCFAIFFSFFGTVLGGLWADDSWGRFWGWDPKENGALIIVLWNALILHARWGGMVKEKGLAMLALFGNVVTAWSWFGVNELGIGLHSYGFTDGMALMLVSIFFVHLITLAVMAFIPRQRMWTELP